MTANIHQSQSLITFGSEIEDAELAVIMLHGRGATAESMESLAVVLGEKGIHYLAPQANANSWYPQSAFAPIEANEPYLTSALEMIDDLVRDLRDRGVMDKQIVFGGFSQGACLAAEHVARNPKKYGGLFVFSGALIGPPDRPHDYAGSFEGMPVFIGGSDVDPWVAHEFLVQTANVFEGMGAEVDLRIYPGMAHTVNQNELDRVRAMLAGAARSES